MKQLLYFICDTYQACIYVHISMVLIKLHKIKWVYYKVKALATRQAEVPVLAGSWCSRDRGAEWSYRLGITMVFAHDLDAVFVSNCLGENIG